MNEHRLNNLLSLWQVHQLQGRDVQATELCRDCPELAEELNRRIQALRQMNALAQSDGAPSATRPPDPNLPLVPGNIQTVSRTPSEDQPL
jgi:hypothetical protein